MIKHLLRTYEMPGTMLDVLFLEQSYEEDIVPSYRGDH
jgi:hypothetical protein